MKVTLINTTDAGGGAPEACMRLLKALERKHVDVNMLVQQKKTGERRVYAVVKNTFDKWRATFNFLLERLPFMLLHEKDKTVRFAFSTATVGATIINEQHIQDADILHLHWTNRGFLSTNNLRQLINLNKPVVWTLHDMWAFTGGCHYAGDCTHFTHHCGNCHFLRDFGPHDISYQGWLRKAALLKDASNITIVTCSNWLADLARTSTLMAGLRIEAIPNPIDTTVFSPKDKATCRQNWDINPNAKIILFGAANIMDRRKGITYLIEALDHLREKYEWKGAVELVVFGKNRSFDFSLLPFKVYQLDIITSQNDLTELYSLADVFVSPSVEDNLPNMVMESLACGTPVVAFNTGGIPDMVVHLQNGYLAAHKSATDLAKGIYEILTSPTPEAYARQARGKVLSDFSNEKVAAQYIALYQSLLN